MAEEAEGHLGFAAGFALLQALLAAPGKLVVHCPRVADILAGNAGDHHNSASLS